jgi:hypothetical protein
VTGTKPLRYAGIWYSQKSHDQYSPQGNSEFIASFAGAYKALLEEHVPVGFVFDERAADTMLENYAVLLLANVVRLNADDIALLTEFVSRGGGLVSFGAVGSLSTTPVPEALSNLLGLRSGVGRLRRDRVIVVVGNLLAANHDRISSPRVVVRA